MTTTHSDPSTGPANSTVRYLRSALGALRTHRRAYLILNLLMYGAFLLGMGAALLWPELNTAKVAGQNADGTTDLVTDLLRNPWLFGLTIFAVNVGTVALAAILLPSMIVPFAGIALGVYKAFQFGVTLAPVDDTIAMVLIPHSLTILIELQAYVLVMFGAYLLGRAWLSPGTVGAPNRRRGYLTGLRWAGRVCTLALILFVVGAAYEAWSITYLVPRILN